MDNEEYLKQLAETEKKNKNIELEQAKAAALRSVSQQEASIMPEFTAQKKQASVQSQLGAKNLAEYWANRGQTQAGISAQAELSRQNALTGQLSSIGSSEAAQQLAFNQQRGEIGTDYQNQMTNFSNQVDQDLTENLYNEQIRQQQAKAEQERYLAEQQAKAEQEAYERALEQAKFANTLNQQEFENQLALNKYNLSVYNANKGSQTKTPLTKQGNYKNVTIPYTTNVNEKPIKSAVTSGNKVVYNLVNGSTVEFDLGTNPYTGTLNKDAVETQFNKNTGKYEKVLKTFANGYQPNNVNGTKLVNTGAVVNNNKINENVRVWTTGDGKFYYWDSTANKYQKLTQNEAKAVGVVASTKATGGTTAKGYSPNIKSVGFR